MATQTIRIGQGVNTQLTPELLGTAGWTTSNLIRFKDGLPQKLDGWAHINSTPLVGTGRGMHAWADLTGNAYVAIGTEQRLQLFWQGQMYDITPLRATTNNTPDFSTINTSKTVTIKDISHGATVGDWIYLVVPVSVGGIVLQGFYQVQSVIDANDYTITAASAATSTVNHGGDVPSYTSTNLSGNITVTLNNHGLVAASPYTAEISTTVATVVIVGIQSVIAPVTTNTFTIAPGGTANANSTVSENSGNAQIQYLYPTGYATSITLSGYGIGDYGAGDYGIASAGQSVNTTIRQWHLDNWGQDGIGNYTLSPIFVWVPTPTSNPNNVAIAINATNFTSATSPPTQVISSFVSSQQQMVIALGCDPGTATDPDATGTTLDPCLVRWCDVGDFTQWTATTGNQAGSFRLNSGSKIIGGLRGQNVNYIWTDVGFWVMQYIQPPLVWGFVEVSTSAELMASRAAAAYGSRVFWAADNDFMVYDGNSVQVLPCAVWDQFFKNINTMQVDKVFAAIDSMYSEVFWFYPSLNSSEVDSYVKYNMVHNVWDYGSLIRTCWIDHSVVGNAIGTDTQGLLQQHNTGYDNDGAAMSANITSGFFAMADGTAMSFLERLLLDFRFLNNGSTQKCYMNVLVQDYAENDTPIVYGPYTITPTLARYAIVRARGRFVAIEILWTDLGAFSRFGGTKAIIAPAGGRTLK